MTDITSEQSILDSVDINAENESLALINKNDFVLKIINEIGTALDKKYKEIKEFDFKRISKISSNYSIIFIRSVMRRKKV